MDGVITDSTKRKVILGSRTFVKWRLRNYKQIHSQRCNRHLVERIEQEPYRAHVSGENRSHTDRR